MNLIVFCTTMGHGGRHTYEETINSILDQAGDFFSRRIIHLKTKPSQEDKAEEIKDFAAEKNFRIIESKADLVHHSSNHQVHSAEYFKDVFKTYSDPTIRKEKYSFWLEDDWILRTQEQDLVSALRESENFLDNNTNQLCVRFNSAEEFKKCEQDHFRSPSRDIFTQGLKYTQWGPTFTFQPNVNRTIEVYAAWKAAQRYLDILGQYHCELLSGDLMKNLTESPTPFSFYNPEKIYAQHIG